MNLPWNRKEDKPTVVWTYKPYGFEPGQRYVIEIDRRQVDLAQLKELDKYFQDGGINCKLVLTSNGNAIKPLEVKTMERHD